MCRSGPSRSRPRLSGRAARRPLVTGAILTWLAASACADLGLDDGNEKRGRTPKAPPPVEIVDVSYEWSYHRGGEITVLTTTGFLDDFTVWPPVVSIGETRAASRPVGPDRLEVVTVAHPVGTADVEVRSANGLQIARRTDAITYVRTFPRPPWMDDPPPTTQYVFALERTSSMASPAGTWQEWSGWTVSGSHWDRAVGDLRWRLERLGPGRDFGIVVYDCDAYAFRTDLVPATAENVSAALEWLATHDPARDRFRGDTPSTGPAVERAGRLVRPSGSELAAVYLYAREEPDCGVGGITGHTALAISGWPANADLYVYGMADWGYASAFHFDLALQTGGFYDRLASE